MLVRFDWRRYNQDTVRQHEMTALRKVAQKESSKIKDFLLFLGFLRSKVSPLVPIR